MSEMVSDSSEVVSVVSKDLKELLQSDSDEIPRSLKQLPKIARYEEFSNSVVRVSLALTVGILRGYGSENKSEIEEVGASSFIDMDRMMSTVGTRFVSVVVVLWDGSLAIICGNDVLAGDPGVAPGSCSSRKESKPLNSRSASLFLMNYFPTIAVQNGACKEHSTQLVDTAAAGYKAAGNMMPNYVAVNFYMVLKYLLLTDAGAITKDFQC
ncbi:hypothetical protein T459_02933 [Capsicum annuum]|uniref:Uncharacterized protein n=1 Tax=Capsicum annuum TaxID=4072 RepID=A0A2G3ALD7_CAPAN|nr:hypothetical protein T459_02933 [Capsicum annuum]